MGYVKHDDKWVPLHEDQSPPTEEELAAIPRHTRPRFAMAKRLANGTLSIGRVWDEPIDDCPVWTPGADAPKSKKSKTA